MLSNKEQLVNVKKYEGYIPTESGDKLRKRKLLELRNESQFSQCGQISLKLVN